MEQALKSGTCSALLGWLDLRHVTSGAAAPTAGSPQRGHLAFLFRPESAAQEASPAELRLRLEAGGNAQEVRLHVLKRRGGWPLEPFELALNDPLSQQLGPQLEMASDEPRPLDVTIPVLPLAAAPSSLPSEAAETPRRLWPPGALPGRRRCAFRDTTSVGAPGPSFRGDGTPQAARH